MAKRTLILLGAVIFLTGLGSGLVLASRYTAQAGPQTKVLLDNQRVTVTEVTMAPGAQRPPYTRPTDQIIVFLDEARYEAVDGAGSKQQRQRADGEIIWHSRGEAAPLLINTHTKPYRNLIISLK